MPFTFIVTTQEDRGTTPKTLSQINSHIAGRKYTRVNYPESTDYAQVQTWRPNLNAQYVRKTKRDGRLSFLIENRARSQPSSRTLPEDSIRKESIQNLQNANKSSPTRDNPLIADLDPFIKPAIELSGSEKGLLHFWLTSGRQVAFGGSSWMNPDFCPALHTASRLLQNNAVYIHVHLAMAETILERRRGNSIPNSASYYEHQKNAYNAMARILNNQNASQHDVMASLIQLSSLELVTGRSDLHKKHVQALKHIIADNGGAVSYLIRARQHQRSTLAAHWFISAELALYCHSEVPLPTEEELDLTITSYVGALAQARDWIVSNTTCSTNDHTVPDSRALSCRTNPTDSSCVESIPTLRLYLAWIVDTFLRNPSKVPRYSMLASAFNFISQMLFMPAIYSYDSTTSLRALRYFDNAIKQCTGPTPTSSEPRSYQLNTISAAFMLSCMRYTKEFPNEPEIELKYFEVTTHAVRLLPLLSEGTLLRLAETCVNLVLVVADTSSGVTKQKESHLAELEDSKLAELRQEIWMNWVFRNTTGNRRASSSRKP